MSVASGSLDCAIVANPVRPAAPKQGPSLSREQRAELTAERRLKQATVEEDIAGWYQDSVAFAESLSHRFGQNTEHYLNMMFSGAPKLKKLQRKLNPYNAWLHHKSQEEGDMDAVEIAETHGDEYDQLTSEQKKEYLQELARYRESQQYGLRLTQRSRTLDINNAAQTLEDTILGLQVRVGVDGFYCLFRNTADYQMKPRWFFTNPKIAEFLAGACRKFDPATIGVLAEAFAIAGSDYLSALRSPQEKAAYLKREIIDMISRALVEITGDANAVMSYVHYTRDIQIKYGITLENWKHPEWACPSDLSNAIAPLVELRDDLANGKCKFVKLTPTQLEEIKANYDRRVQAGEVPTRKKRSDAGKPRKKRSDAGKPRKKRAGADGGEANDGGDGGPPAKRPRPEDPEDGAHV
ncbi:hypothetical protein OH77DRAFT_1426033 [Trametes cingulata]|nr:hypothetical protein OH77DRAFT_1426033 [Trametes cingulata]